MPDLHSLDSMRGHSLVPTAKELAVIPALYATDGLPFEDKTIHLRYFAGGAASWLIAEVDPSTWVMFGYCDLGHGFPEWGYVSLHELASLQVDVGDGLVVLAERDLHFVPQLFKA